MSEEVVEPGVLKEAKLVREATRRIALTRPEGALIRCNHVTTTDAASAILRATASATPRAGA